MPASRAHTLTCTHLFVCAASAPQQHTNSRSKQCTWLRKITLQLISFGEWRRHIVRRQSAVLLLEAHVRFPGSSMLAEQIVDVAFDGKEQQKENSTLKRKALTKYPTWSKLNAFTETRQHSLRSIESVRMKMGLSDLISWHRSLQCTTNNSNIVKLESKMEDSHSVLCNDKDKWQPKSPEYIRNPL